MGTINIKKLASELNLSAATVSRALRDSHEISAKTKQRVMELAQKLHYEPNPSASNLRSHKTNTIAVIIPEVANNFFSQAINGIEEIARHRNYHVLIYQSHEKSETESSIIRSLLSGRVDGILISVASDTNDNRNFRELIQELPLVFFDRVYEDIDAVKITTDDYESCYNATQHLIDRNCKRIAYLKALDNLTTGKRRTEGYLDALKANHIPFDDRLMLSGGKDEAENCELVKSLLNSYRPDGVIVSIEELALPCYHACKMLGLAIPADVKVISFSNLKTAALLNPSLTTITQPAFEIGKEAATVLFKILDKKHFEPDETRVLKSVLIRRESTGNF